MRSVTTRTQRRMERKQAMLLLLMVLAVALVSFTLGVMVGRSGSAPVATDGSDSGRVTVSKHPAPVSSDEETAREAGANLTFYETLPKGEKTPLGSGINLPPNEEKNVAGGEPAAGAVAEKRTPEVREQTASADTVTEHSPASEGTGETFLLQVASFRTIKGALALQERLHRKGYPAQVREVDLGDKGMWSRVLVGPFPSRKEARTTLERLKREERLSPMIRKG